MLFAEVADEVSVKILLSCTIYYYVQFDFIYKSRSTIWFYLNLKDALVKYASEPMIFPILFGNRIELADIILAIREK